MVVHILNKFLDIKFYTSDPLLKNSFLIIMTSASNAGFGFLFWLLAAKLYLPNDVGIATALTSSITLIILLSRMGLDYSMIRFFPEGNKSEIFNTSLIVSSTLAIALGTIFILGIDIFSPELQILKSFRFSLIFLICLIFGSLVTLTGTTLVALMKTNLSFFQSLIISSRVIFIIFLIPYKVAGILISIAISFILAFGASLTSLKRLGIYPYFKLNTLFLRETFNFSLTNYLSGLMITAPSLILPIMVLNILGANETAYFYISFSIASILFMIPNAISTSLLVECSNGGSLKKAALKSLIAVFFISVPLILFLYIKGDLILELMGEDYVKGFGLLRIIVLSDLLVILIYIYFAIKRIKKDMRNLLNFSLLLFIFILIFCYTFMNRFGLIGIGYGWTLSYAICLILIIIKEYKKLL